MAIFDLLRLMSEFPCWPSSLSKIALLTTSEPGGLLSALLPVTKTSSSIPALTIPWSSNRTPKYIWAIYCAGFRIMRRSRNEPLASVYPVAALTLSRILSRAGGAVLGLWLSGPLGGGLGDRFFEPQTGSAACGHPNGRRLHRSGEASASFRKGGCQGRGAHARRMRAEIRDRPDGLVHRAASRTV